MSNRKLFVDYINLQTSHRSAHVVDLIGDQTIINHIDPTGPCFPPSTSIHHHRHNTLDSKSESQINAISTCTVLGIVCLPNNWLLKPQETS